MEKIPLLTTPPQKKPQKPLLILRKAWAYLQLRSHKESLQTIHSLDSGQGKWLIYQTKTKRHRWLVRKPERRHSVELEALDEQDHRPYRHVLRRTRPLFPRPKFYSKSPNAEGVSLKYAGFILQHIVWQRLRE